MNQNDTQMPATATAPRAIEVNCYLAGCTRRADRTVGIRLVTTAEAPPELMTALDLLHQADVTVLLAQHREAEIENFDAPRNARGHTPSQEMRFALYGLYRQLEDAGAVAVPFETFYAQEMRKMIARIRYGGDLARPEDRLTWDEGGAEPEEESALEAEAEAEVEGTPGDQPGCQCLAEAGSH